MNLFRLTRKMKRLMKKKDQQGFCKYMEKMQRKGKLKHISMKQAESEGLIRYAN